MITVIPAINTETWESVAEKIRRVEPFVEWVHIDVADGTFTPNTLWHNPLDLVGFQTTCKIEIHLMAEHPEELAEAWLVEPVKRIIAHYETTHAFDLLEHECRSAGIEIGMSVATHTSWTNLKPFIGRVNMLQVLAVNPGMSGQKFEHHNLSKIKHLRALAPELPIEVDGGVNADVAHACMKAGANIVVAGSYIFHHPSPKMAIQELAHTHI